MKNSQKCPKCGNEKILRIPGGLDPSGNSIPAGLTVFSSVLVTRFLCVTCGFSEEWIEDKSDIQKLQKNHDY